ncbi:ROK family transcriptional regulator [uncultured Maritimibacter sp.]|uniref:ROK family transcriptional regulator n=1 Tax=uncultured Maritimibacter sp. TaxID=991866 RepID=UPI000AEADA69|nr:ROK family transcriptional regulator [uncultured Maritimibacter sp.]
MDGNDTVSPERYASGAGVNQLGARAHNERLLLSLVQRNGALPGAEIAKLTGLSAQTVSNILRKLEADGLLLRGEPQRRGVGKPSIPMGLDPDGALSFGMKLGRRTADLAVVDLTGRVLGQRLVTYPYPMPDAVFQFLKDGMAALSETLTPRQRANIVGLGIAAPSEMWNWIDALGAPQDFSVWQDIDIAAEVARFSDLPIFIDNDATAACRAEHHFGRGRAFPDYAYFFIGSFVGGGVVMTGAVVDGVQGNAGAFGSIQVPGRNGGYVQLIEEASLYLLQESLEQIGIDGLEMWRMPQDWSGFGVEVERWIERAAQALAHASRAACAVIDFPTILIDGAFPPVVRDRLVMRTQALLGEQDTRGLIAPRIEAAAIGGNARVIGAASAPLFSRYFLT